MQKIFEKMIEGDVPVIVDFYASWNNTCLSMNPMLEKVKKAVGSNATILKMDVEKNLFYAQKYAVNSTPTLMIFKKGKILWRKSGAVTSNEIYQNLAPHV